MELKYKNPIKNELNNFKKREYIIHMLMLYDDNYHL